MKVFICNSNISHTGYELQYRSDNGEVTKVLPIEKFYPGEPTTLVLPENESNRKYFSSKKVDDTAEGEIELTYKESRQYGSRPGQTTRKPLEDYLTDEERAIYNDLIAKAKQRREEATKKPKLTDLEKAERALAAAKAKLEALKQSQSK